MRMIEKVARSKVLHVAKMFGRAIKGSKTRGFSAAGGHSVPLRPISRKKELAKAFKATGREAAGAVKRNPGKAGIAAGAAGTYALTS